MRRRHFISLAGIAPVMWPLVLRAEQPNRALLIGILMPTRAEDPAAKLFVDAFGNQLNERGSASRWTPKFEYRFGGGDTNATLAGAKELISMRPAVIVAISNTSMAALHRVATTIPIVFTTVSDPVGMGYVDSLSRPGHNVTGLTPFEPSLGSKWLSLLSEVAPNIEEVGVIFNPEPGNNSGSFLRSIEGAATSFHINKIVTPRDDRADIERTIIDVGKTPNCGLLFLPDALTYARRDKLVELIAEQRIPAIYPWDDFVIAGGLISYGPGTGYWVETAREAANYVRRIIDGERAGDLPVQAPTKLLLSLNAKVAKTLGLKIPARVMALAEKVIE